MKRKWDVNALSQVEQSRPVTQATRKAEVGSYPEQEINFKTSISKWVISYLFICLYVALSRYLCVCVHMCVYTQIHTYIHIAGYVVSHLTIMENTALLDKIVKTLASFWITIPICIYLWVLLNISFFKKLQWLPTPLPLKQWFLCRGHSLKGVCFLR